MTQHPALSTPVQLGRHTLRNRIVLPPLTRQRAARPGDVPIDLMARRSVNLRRTALRRLLHELLAEAALRAGYENGLVLD